MEYIVKHHGKKNTKKIFENRKAIEKPCHLKHQKKFVGFLYIFYSVVKHHKMENTGKNFRNQKNNFRKK